MKVVARLWHPAAAMLTPAHSEYVIMTGVHSSSTSALSKTEKRRRDFLLFPHATGRWAKKTDARSVYFGKWDDADGGGGVSR
jgi:hypothetical protein